MSNIVDHAYKMKMKKSDIYYTPLPVVKRMIEMCDINPDMSVLDPCYGAGAFYENLPDCNKSWCEIEKGIDFFENNNKYDLVIGNPPFSLWNKWLEHTIKITDKFCYIFGALNFTEPRLRKIQKAGFGITKIHMIGVAWWFGTSFIVVFEKGKPSIISVEEKRVVCDICNTCCKRGFSKNSPNECTKVL